MGSAVELTKNLQNDNKWIPLLKPESGNNCLYLAFIPACQKPHAWWNLGLKYCRVYLGSKVSLLLRINSVEWSTVSRVTCRPARAQREYMKGPRGQEIHEEVPPLCSLPTLSCFSSNCITLKSKTNLQMVPVYHCVEARAEEPHGRHLWEGGSQPSPGM